MKSSTLFLSVSTRFKCSFGSEFLSLNHVCIGKKSSVSGTLSISAHGNLEYQCRGRM